MKITIKGFKKYLDDIFIFERNKLILLSGKSGIGKSTVLEAIYWCLFGNMRGIYNNAKLVKKCIVIIETDDNIILRQASPGLFRLIIKHQSKPNQIYESKVAQQIVNNKFGCKDIWLLTSYLKQGCYCPLLTGSNADKMKFLTKLSFLEDNPLEYIEKISGEIKEVNVLYRDRDVEYQTTKKIFDKQNAEFISESKLSSKRLVKKIAYTDDDVHQCKEDIRNLKKILTTLNKKLKRAEGVKVEQHSIKRQIRELNNEENTINKRLDKYNTDLDYNQLILDCRDEIAKLTKNNILMEQSIADIDELMEQKGELKKINKKIKNLRDEMDKREITLSDLKEELADQDDIDSIFESDEINLSDSVISKIESLNSDMIQRNMSDWKKNKALTTKFKINYDEQSKQDIITKIEETISKLDQSMKIKPLIDNVDQDILELKKISSKLTYTDINVISENLEKYQTLLPNLIMGQNLKECPHCGASIRIVDNELKPADVDPASSNEIDNTKKQIKFFLEQKKKLLKKNFYDENIKKLMNQIIKSDSNSKTISEDDISEQYQLIKDKYQKFLILSNLSQLKRNFTSRLKKIEKLVILKKPEISLQSVQLLKKYLNLVSSTELFNQSKNELISSLEEQRKHLIVDDSTTSNRSSLQNSIRQNTREIKNYRTKISEYDRNSKKIDLLKNNLLDIKVKIPKLSIKIDDNTEIEYLKISTDISENDNNMKVKTKYLEYLGYEIDMIKKKNKLEEIKEKLISLGKLKEIALKLECDYLEESVNHINNMMNVILETIFCDDIPKVKLNLYKELKSKRKGKFVPTKQCLNLNIRYKNADYSNISELSGGEATRISLALTLALSNISNSQFLMLDETMSTLDSDLRELCLNSIKEHIGESKTILVINHGDVEGYYDKVHLFNE